MHLELQGTVQGIGFRPFVYRLARSMALSGWVRNSSRGAEIEIEGSAQALDKFKGRLYSEKPRAASITAEKVSFTHSPGYTEFIIASSNDKASKSAGILPDLAICRACLKDIFETGNRRYLYPFTNCTNCGPRFSIIERLPYDRHHTTMKAFTMCDECREEYENPLDRRFHAQPNACPRCGPQMELWDRKGKVLERRNDAVQAACEAIRSGKIVAVKGLGGFQLMVDARQGAAVSDLRRRKGREEKPLALMYPDMEAIRKDCDINSNELGLLSSAAAPIVLLRRKSFPGVGSSGLSDLIAPGNPYLGIMMPYTPLHHIITAQLGFPVVATSGNLSDEPICIDEHEAFHRLGKIADLFLVHNRPIFRQMDDSVVRPINDGAIILRSARGYAPTIISTDSPGMPVLAVGANQKNSLALGIGKQVLASQHIGDPGSRYSSEALANNVDSLLRAYDLTPKVIICDRHPDYIATQYAERQGRPVVKVQHHYAHVLSCMVDNKIETPVLGVTWDGTGLGDDSTIWGGEFLYIDKKSYKRVGHFRHFRLPGGEAAIREPGRAALGVLYAIYGDSLFSKEEITLVKAFKAPELKVLHRMLARGINSPISSSAGRLFDAAAALIGLGRFSGFEGQAAMRLEFAAEQADSDEVYGFDIIQESGIHVIDWEPMFIEMLDDIKKERAPSLTAAKFHNTMADIIVEAARLIGEKKVALTGGCFQNRYLTERAIRRLKSSGFTPYRHRTIPPNDGGIATGQIMAALRSAKEKQ